MTRAKTSDNADSAGSTGRTDRTGLLQQYAHSGIRQIEDTELIQVKVQEAFLAHSRGAVFPAPKQSIQGAFLAPPRGLAVFTRSRRRSEYTRFIKELQLQFGIYFSPNELESIYSAERLTDLIQEKLKRNKAGALCLLKHHSKGGPNTLRFILLNTVFALPVSCLARVSATHAYLLLAIALLADGLFVAAYLRERNYNARLAARIQQR